MIQRLGFFAILTICVLASLPVKASERAIPLYYDQLQFNLTGPSAYETVIGGYANPAVYGMLSGSEGIFGWSDRNNNFSSMDDWGAFLGGSNMGLGTVRSDISDASQQIRVNDWRLGFAGGNRNTTLGMGFGWSSGDKDLAGRSTLFQIGTVNRIGRYASFGIVGAFAFEKSYQTGIFDVAVRPLGDDRLALFADAEYAKGFGLSNMPWSAGAMLEFVPGAQLIGRYFENESFMLSLCVGFGGLKGSGSPSFDSSNDVTNTIYEVRTGFEQPSWYMNTITRDDRYLTLEPRQVSYRAYKYFDSGNDPLYQILSDLEKAKTDPQVSGVAISLHRADMSHGKAWELREKLQEVRDAGKHVVIYVGDMNMTRLHVASVADRVIIDPEGFVIVTGFALSRTYVADALAKLGIGFDEWRFFTHKSAVETFSRTSMSDADREQRLSLVEARYSVVRDEVSASMNISAAEFDRIINEETLIAPQRAVELGIADQVGRWVDVPDVIKELEGDRKFLMGRDQLIENRIASTLWGEDPEIAVVYALGECAFDTGIRARSLDAIVERLGRDPNVKAIVLRVDSPGGSAQASDWVAQRLREIMKHKPVVVSQGDVAASGGYWLSMYSNKLFALPTTVTGSIGVIGGWLWDEGLGEKIGHTSDLVRKGDRADIGYGIRLLLGGPMLPARNLTQDERDRVKSLFMDGYDAFVEQVAEGRGLTKDRVAELAEGRVYSGIEGKELGLIDEIGGLAAAIQAARDLAGIDPDEHVRVGEYPVMAPFDFTSLRWGIPFISALGWLGGDDNPAQDPEPAYDWVYVKSILDAKGRPLYMLPPEYDFE